ncbi:MAG: DUF3576 domain-containing protein [Rhodospirillaceae bacterium]|jgi:hypothetical protein|nr:DUF3576 domain-containing protein [Rhodospirillaceae bacterium]MBT6119401.1 DUF3576 domain-containing protein [Rhodospirillaceae bacterium]
MDGALARLRLSGALILVGMLLLACTESPPGQAGGVQGSDGFTYFSGGAVGGAGGAPVSVNTFLWRASLDTVSFMPLISADAYGGVLITDWYAPPETPDERFKINLFVSGQALRAESVKAVVFRQIRQGSEWRDSPVDPSTARGLENTVLTRARQLRAEVQG